MHMTRHTTTARDIPHNRPGASFVADTAAGPVVIFLDATGALLEDLDDWTPELARAVAAIGGSYWCPISDKYSQIIVAAASAVISALS